MSDILEQVERSRALRDVPLVQELIAEVERWKKIAHKQARRTAGYRLAAKRHRGEVERLQDLIDSPPEEADWLHDDARLCGEITTGVVQIARKWHSAYRKAQNSNLMRAKEIERLRSENNRINKLREAEINQAGAAERVYLEAMMVKDARIKELEGMIKQLGSLAFMADYTPLDQIIAHFMSWGQSNYEYTSRLEVAFLRSNAAMRYYQEGNRGPWPQLGEKFKEPYQEKAREELERIRNGE